MRAVLVDMEIERDTGFAQGHGEIQAVLDLNAGVLVGMPDETRRGFGGYLLFIGECVDQPQAMVDRPGRFLREPRCVFSPIVITA